MTQQKQIQKSAVRPAIFSWFRVSVSLSRNISASVGWNVAINTVWLSLNFCEKKILVAIPSSSIDNVKIFENSLGKCRHYWDKNHPLTKHKSDKRNNKKDLSFSVHTLFRLLKAFRFISLLIVSLKRCIFVEFETNLEAFILKLSKHT